MEDNHAMKCLIQQHIHIALSMSARLPSLPNST